MFKILLFYNQNISICQVNGSLQAADLKFLPKPLHSSPLTLGFRIAF